MTDSDMRLVDWTVAAFFSSTISTLVSGMFFKVVLAAMTSKLRDLELAKAIEAT